MENLPNALVIGPQKAGTSWLHEYFGERGDICLPHGVKEVFFFDRYFSKGENWYAAHFAHQAKQHKLCMEVGPTIFEEPEGPKRVRDTLGDIPVVCTLRDPASRTWSLYQHYLRYGMTRLPFRDAVEQLDLYRGSQYFERLQGWQAAISPDNILIVYMDDLKSTPEEFVKQICSHLRIPFEPIPERLQGKYFEGGSAPNFWIAKATTIIAQTLRSLRLYRVVNAIRDTGLKDKIFGGGGKDAEKKDLSVEDREWLLENYLLNDINSLEALTNRDLSAWKELR